VRGHQSPSQEDPYAENQLLLLLLLRQGRLLLLLPLLWARALAGKLQQLTALARTLHKVLCCLEQTQRHARPSRSRAWAVTLAMQQL
jgi:hypothetical protein